MAQSIHTSDTPISGAGRRTAGPRLIALVGPFQSGKTTLLESILARTGALQRQGRVPDGTSIGDASPEARAHVMSTEPNIASTDYLGDRYTFIDCPGSIEFLHHMRNVLPVCDAAIVVCEADSRKIPLLQVILHELEELGIPRFLFLNKIDLTTSRVRETLAMLQPASRVPLLLRQIPIWQNGIATGFIDLALERAFIYREHAASTVVDVPAGELPREKEARYSMLERLADYDDALMEQLIADIEPPRDRVFDDLAAELRGGHVLPLLIGSAERGNGVTRLMKALRHETPGIAATRQRLGIADAGEALGHVMRTIHTAHGGKLSVARVLRGSFADGVVLHTSRGQEDRLAGLSRLMGSAGVKVAEAGTGDTLAFGRLDHAVTGDSFTDANKTPAPLAAAAVPAAVQTVALAVKDRKDEVRLATALHKLGDEDPSLVFLHEQETGALKILGQGEMHVRVALERLVSRFGVQVASRVPAIAYKETIRDAVNVRGRHKKQSGGHGQFGDVALDIAPKERGEGFVFHETVHGGSVPRTYFSSVEIGAKDGLAQGPLGFPVVDVGVTLTDGSYHAVDSSDLAFRLAARTAIADALPRARPVLLEPVLAVGIIIPEAAMAQATGLVAARRGQILGYDTRPGWPGWIVLQARMPEAETANMIIELRSATAGVGTYTAQFDHLAELSGKPADLIVAQRKKELERAG